MRTHYNPSLIFFHNSYTMLYDNYFIQLHVVWLINSVCLFVLLHNAKHYLYFNFIAMQFNGSSVFVSEPDDDDHCFPYISTTSVHIVFFHLVDQITELLQQCDHQQLLMRCREIKASEIHGIHLYTGAQLSEYGSTLLLLKGLCYYSTSL